MQAKACQKSLVISNTHQLVMDNDKRLVETINYVNAKVKIYGRRKPVRFAVCCMTFLIYGGKTGYKDGHTTWCSIFTMTDKNNELTVNSFRKGLKVLKVAESGVVCIPGVDLCHQSYLSLRFMAPPGETPGLSAKKDEPEWYSRSQITKRPPEVTSIPKTPSQSVFRKLNFDSELPK